MLPDNTILRYISQDYKIETLVYNPSADDWNLLEQTVPIPYQALYSFYADENILIYGNEGSNFTLHERTIGDSWSFSTNIEVNTTSVCYTIIPNQKDAILFIYSDKYGNDLRNGFILVYTKIADEWIQTQVITSDELPLSPEVNGITKLSLTAHDGSAAIATSKHIVIPFADATKADYNAQTMPESFYSIPICLFDPIDVTCHHIETSNSCGDIVDFMNGQGYTINSDQSACGEISAMVIDSTYQNNTSTLTYTVTFGFDRNFVSTSCNATLTCNALTSSTPTGSNYPIPDLPSDPNGNLAPSKKTSDTNPISSVSGHIITVLSLIIAIIVF